MENQELIRIVEAIRNSTFKQLESADNYTLVFHDEETNSIISVNKFFHKLMMGRNFQSDLDLYVIEQEPYLICGLKFFKVENSPLPF
ncbi:MAG: hypothetical protein Q8T04_14275 [Bacteroidota bacterium]|nr:hypothetical protein [Bacteroidota bacterium]